MLSSLKELKNVTDSKQGLNFFTNVNPGENGRDEKTVHRDGTIEDLTVRFYPGQENNLELKIYIEPHDDEGRKQLIDYPGDKNVLAGDDETIEFEIAREVEKDDVIVVEYQNQSGSYEYDYRLSLSVDYAGGITRVFN